ncbi:penicillin-binding protein 2 [Oxalobacter formigenes]|uniref:Peptidoglycan D,D-transpeptidase MrdA n=1 Tax=Oxalobacter formigenes OXCC13 TaxID=556269 RepID=C3XAP9_OXAFO|nr:penicillin-binding protein 2 [Oxalobacter formigenes]ARQ45573.1 Penicillin-binding protein 2 [Oxalobacter formigenes]ARQ77826.1 penicillin-binding protein 2 [Oxalobacter formigenes OXCC13]EEO30275.1 penicillin-binding protein 2 [Oxalobacter formigenes OXCC13]MCZ4062007.1 penicillin-binding protein 2 [Oxalobacter formigenes]QDX33631.1 penicillin-binding protein 2 [Oxalobacter formigenes]
MSSLNDSERELHQFRNRIAALVIFILVCFFFLLLRFIWVQIVRHSNYVAQAEENRISIVPTMPSRGIIMDRNGVILANNYSAYTLEITPAKIGAKLEDVIEELSQIIEITPRDRKRFKKRMEETKRFESIVLKAKLTDEEVARFSVQRYRFPGVEVQARMFRQYPLGDVASHVIGYIGRMSQKDLDNLPEEEETNYQGTTHYGKEGLEKSYERVLHGSTGYEEMEVAASGRAVRTLSTHPTVPGNNLVLSIDIELQKVVENAFGNRRGALIAMDPSTGEVLAYVSKPTFDPNLFVDGIDQQNWDELNNSINKPLINRPIRGAYPPGSTYKPFMALAALELGYRKPTDAISDPGYFDYGNHRFRDDKKGGHGIVDMYKSIVQSCDTYYYVLAAQMGVDTMHDFMKQFGFGELTGIDLAHERKGILPSTEWKRNAYKNPNQKKWYAGETISLGIGQGYNTFTPLQLAYATALLANNGSAARPHLVKDIEDGMSHERRPVTTETVKLNLKQENIDVIKRAMVGVMKEGTGARVFAGTGYTAGGKTGTAQVITIGKNEKYNAAALAEHKRDHALFTAFAPVDNPKIVIALIVENGGFGASAAAPIARKAMDYFFYGKKSAPEAVQSGNDDAYPEDPDDSQPVLLPPDSDEDSNDEG